MQFLSSFTRVLQVMAERRQPYGYRPIGQAPRVLNDSLPDKERDKPHRQKSLKSYKVPYHVYLTIVHTLSYSR